MDPTAIANLIVIGLNAGIEAYIQLRAANPNTVPPLSTVLAAADADWDADAKLAQAQLNPPAPAA